MSIPYDIKSKIILVTGANRGIGKEIVECFMRSGAKKVYAAVRSLDSAKPLVEIYGEKVVPVQIDLDRPETIIAAAAAAGDVQVVVNNAGILRNATAMDSDAIDALQQEMNINVFSLMRMAHAFASILKSNGGGAFVQLNSIASLKCFTQFTTYSASKAAAYSITQALRDLLGQQKTAVLSVHPGPIATDMANAAGFGEISEPASLVAEGIVNALKAGDFHLFPDSMAKQVGTAYRSFAENVVEADEKEG